MKPIKKILVPTDLFQSSFSSMDYALELAKKYKAKIYLLHVLDKSSISMFSNLYTDSDEPLGDIEEKAYKLMEKILKEYGKTNINSTNVVWGTPYKEIVDFAEKNEIDIIIMTTNTKPGFSRFLLGSVTENVIRYSNLPVLTLRTEKVENDLMKPSIEEPHLV